MGNPTNESLGDTTTHRAELVVNINFRVSLPLGKTSRPFYPPSLCCHCSYNSDTTNRPLSSTTRNGPMPMATAVVRIRMGKFANRAWWSPGHGRVPKILPRCFRGLADAWLFFGLFIFSLTSCRMTKCARASERARASGGGEGGENGEDGPDECQRRATKMTDAAAPPEMSPRPENYSDPTTDTTVTSTHLFVFYCASHES